MAAAVTPDPDPFPIESHWLVSGSLGSDFESEAEDPGVNFSATGGWLWHVPLPVAGLKVTSASPNRPREFSTTPST